MTREQLLAQFIADVKPALVTFFGRFQNTGNVLNRMGVASEYPVKVRDVDGNLIDNPQSRADFIIEHFLFGSLEALYEQGEEARTLAERPVEIPFSDA